MIPIQEVFNSVQDLVNKDQGGYLDSVQFTRNCQSVNTILYEYYYKIFEQTNNVLDALEPFIVQVNLPLSNGILTKPADFRHRIELSYQQVINDCKTPKIKTIPIDYVQANEEAYVLSSAVRKPTIKSPKHVFKNGVIQVYPITLPNANLKYLRIPVNPVYGTTIVNTVNGDFEQFDPATSVNFEFPSQEKENIITLLLMRYGMTIRESAITQFAQTLNV